MPGPDDPDLAARFTDSVAANPGPEPPAGLAAAGPLTFSTGGDRSSLRLHRSDEDLIAAVVAANPRTVVVLVAGSAVLTRGPTTSRPCCRASTAAWRAATA